VRRENASEQDLAIVTNEMSKYRNPWDPEDDRKPRVLSGKKKSQQQHRSSAIHMNYTWPHGHMLHAQIFFLEKGNFNQREFQSMWDGTEVGGGRINYLFIF